MVTAVARETVAVEPRPMVGPLVHQPIARKKEGRIRNKVSVLPVGRFKTLVLGRRLWTKGVCGIYMVKLIHVGFCILLDVFIHMGFWCLDAKNLSCIVPPTIFCSLFI